MIAGAAWPGVPDGTGSDRMVRGGLARQMLARYHTLDVFTDRLFGGNPLAVIPDAAAVPPDRMQAIRGGRRDGLSTMLGISAGLVVHATLSALGLSVLLERSAVAYRAVQWAGAAYLIWLGVDSWWRTRHALPVPAAEAADAAPVPARQAFLEGAATNLLNPKVAVFYLALLPQFVRPGEAVLAQSLFLASLHIGMGMLWLGGLTLTVEASRRWVTRPGVRRGLERASGAFLVAFGVRLALERRP